MAFGPDPEHPNLIGRVICDEQFGGLIRSSRLAAYNGSS